MGPYKPIFSMMHNMGDEAINKLAYPVMVEPDGTVYWGFPSMMSSNCDLDMVNFPHDEQVCVIQYGTVNRCRSFL